MKLENGKIVEITEDELYNLYLKWEMYDIVDFNEYKRKMEKTGCIVISNE